MGLLDTIANAFKRPVSLAPSAPAPTEAEGIPGGGNIAGRLTFEPIAELRDQSGYGRAGTYEPGQWQQIVLSNPFVRMALDHVLRPVAAARVDVIPPAKGLMAQGDADAITAFVKWALTENFNLGHLSKVAAQGALLSGFSLFEPLAVQAPYLASAADQVREDEQLEKGLRTTRAPKQVWALKEVRQCLPNSLDPSSPWRIDETGRLTGIAQMGPVGSSAMWVRSVLPEDRALLFSWNRLAGNFAGESQLRTCWYLAARVMPRILKMAGVTLQREGAGIPQAVSAEKDAKLTPQQRTDILEFFANIDVHENAGIVMPTNWKLEWLYSPITNKGHIIDIYERMGLYILQVFGAQQLVIGTGKTGALSSSETHDARSMAMVMEVLSFLADVYNGARGEADGLVKRLVDWNFGPQPAYPKVKLTPQRPEMSPKELAESIAPLKDAGLITPTLEDQNAIRERLSLPPLSEEQFKELSGAGTTTALNGAQVTAATDLMQRVADGQLPIEAATEALVTFYNVEPSRAAKLMATLKTFEPKPKEPPPGAPQLQPGAESAEEDAPGGEPGKQPPALSASAPRSWTPWRALRASEQKLKLNELDGFFTAQRERFANKVRSEVLVMIANAAPSIERAMSDGVLTPAEVAALPLDTKRLDVVLDELLGETRKAGAHFVRGELADRPFTAAVEDEEAAAAVIDAAKEAVRKRVVNRLRSEIEREALDTMRTGGTAQEVVSRVVARQADTGAFKTDAGSVTTKVFNVGRDEAARMLGGVAEVECSAILDSSTCDPCRSMDGRTAAFNSAEHDAMLPPNRDCDGGDNCRCLLIMIPARGDE